MVAIVADKSRQDAGATKARTQALHPRRGITADRALRLARYFQNAPVFWMNLQTRYDLEVAQDELAAKLEGDVQPLETASSPCSAGKVCERRLTKF